MNKGEKYMDYKSPWEKKEEMKKKANTHTVDMAKKYSLEIEYSIENTTIFDEEGINGDIPFRPKWDEVKIPNIKLLDADSLTGAIKLEQDLDLSNYESKHANVTILNFASYKFAGGGFMNGSMAQEEALCHESTLYNVLRAFQVNYYDENNKNKNRSLYKDKALLSKDVIFTKHGCDHKFNVLTCAAPNFYSASKYCNLPYKENYKVLEKRIDFIYQILAQMDCKNVVLGAWGCGVFGQHPDDVCKLFLDKLKDYGVYFDNIYFAIPKSSHNNNFQEFERIIKEH